VQGAWVSGCGCEADQGALWRQRPSLLWLLVVLPRRDCTRNRMAPEEARKRIKGAEQITESTVQPRPFCRHRALVAPRLCVNLM
jgi:hypothetical protein